MDLLYWHIYNTSDGRGSSAVIYRIQDQKSQTLKLTKEMYFANKFEYISRRDK